MIVLTTNTTKHLKQDALSYVFLFFFTGGIITFCILLALGRDNIIGWGLAILLTTVLNSILYFRSHFYELETNQFTVGCMLNYWFPNASFKLPEKIIEVKDICHVIIEPKPSPIHHSPTMGVKLQKKGRKIIFERFMILRDNEFKSLLIFLDFLKEKEVSYYIDIGTDYQLKKFLKGKNIPLRG